MPMPKPEPEPDMANVKYPTTNKASEIISSVPPVSNVTTVSNKSKMFQALVTNALQKRRKDKDKDKEEEHKNKEPPKWIMS